MVADESGFYGVGGLAGFGLSGVQSECRFAGSLRTDAVDGIEQVEVAGDERAVDDCLALLRSEHAAGAGLE